MRLFSLLALSRAFFCLLLVSALYGTNAQAQTPPLQPAPQIAALPALKPVIACEALKGRKLEGFNWPFTVQSAQKIVDARGNPFCKVTATLAPSSGVQVVLPLKHWTQRLLQLGCDGFCGSINLSVPNATGCMPATNGELALAATDMGHRAGLLDTSWARDPQKRLDFAYRAQHLTALFSRALVNAFYGVAPHYAYFIGCSEGGREALMEAQRYPKDFNGIVVGAPASFLTFQNSFFHGWNAMMNRRPDGTAILLRAKLPVLHRIVMSHCLSGSNLANDVLENPYSCQFSKYWATPCPARATDTANCLTREEIKAADALYDGAHEDSQQFVLGGMIAGSELHWPLPLSPHGRSWSYAIALNSLQDLLLPGTGRSISTLEEFPFNRADFDLVARSAPLYNATNTNLHQFVANGGKLLMWHGLADASISPGISIAYYHGVEKEFGARRVPSFLRLFLFPGVGHCGTGGSYNQANLLTPIMEWTEKGIAPEMISAGNTGVLQPAFWGFQHENSAPQGPEVLKFLPVLAARPVYPYPYLTVYKGQGDPRDGRSFYPVYSDSLQSVRFDRPATDYIGPDNQKNYTVSGDQLVPMPN
ncbi:tannase/feruloyl esterase family alpha/beta hydrolase [Oecophyllibacter saccharovorans]|uniref:Tannase/feruloyl esterase family alpha/beta hydrolase n=1 Tax=Oecophyllibacter saccharovorans TaxID=2558360 RepID=A0A506ULH9_9PROT|nr:tannase/feruloyl esterase family alpha/beta hydrolase [Oecophyllibacter saccharovorans]TPW34023.1 tannase/feruloyl esterase family alpha/beta hydrolase [Oecophyllibacter saccharovorans]